MAGLDLLQGNRVGIGGSWGESRNGKTGESLCFLPFAA